LQYKIIILGTYYTVKKITLRCWI